MKNQYTHGIVMAAFGDHFIALANQAARSVKAVLPDVPIDLFTDRNVDGPFDKVHVVDRIWTRLKLDALLQSRFERTIYLDVDTIAVADFSDAFEVLDKFDLAFAHDQNRNSMTSRTIYREEIPNSFPQLNGGLIVARNNKMVCEFIQRWKNAVEDHGIGKDQPSLRELAWNSDLRIAVLPPEYNFWDIRSIDKLTTLQTAPRILHSNTIAIKKTPDTNMDIDQLLSYYFGRERAYKIKLLIGSDETLAKLNKVPAKNPSIRQRIFLLLLSFVGLPEKIRWALRRALARRKRKARR